MISFKSATPQQLKDWLTHKEALLIDVRELHEYQASSIPQALLIPLGQCDLAALPKAKRYVIQCRSGKRSAQACLKLLTEDPEVEVYNLEGGILAWQEAGYALSSSQPAAVGAIPTL